MGELFDIVVVGAGWFGLAAAKTYLELHPNEKLLVIEAANSFGGTWSKDRLYPGLKSNNMYGSYEYPDFPMDGSYGVKHGEHIPATTLHKYLTDFAKRFGVFERTRLNTKVDVVQPSVTGGWLLEISSSTGVQSIETTKLILATGLTSQPNLPIYSGQECFKPPFFHAKDFCNNANVIKTAKKATIVGGGKSAYDCAYAFAEQGAQVNLIIRPTGQGPVWICPPYVTPFKRMMEELLHTRCLTWFSPCPWGDEDGFGMARSFLHGTGLGRLLVENYWNKLSADVIDSHGYDDHPEVFKLKPWNSALWTGSGVGIHNFSGNLFEMVRSGKIRVYIADIAELHGNSVTLSTGEVLTTDVLICATGWKKESTINFQNLDKPIGLEIPVADIEKLNEHADKDILGMFPILKSQPVLRFDRKEQEPLRNYRFIVPASMVFERNIAYAGMVSTVSTAMFASVQALWISAFFDGKLKRMAKNQDEITKEVICHTRFGKWRYPCGYGSSLPDFAFDALPYVDLLINDLGLKSHRKTTQIAEITEPYKPKDYKGLVQEWLELQGNADTACD